MKEKITIYTNENCPYCKTIKENLEKNKIKFTEKVISECKKEWDEVTYLTALPQLPTILLNGEFFVPGRDYFSPEHLINVIENHKKSKHDHSVRSFERIKTLNFNMSQAFNQMQGAIRNIENKLNEEENVNKSTD